jgi:PAS domain S-box-containing protein
VPNPDPRNAVDPAAVIEAAAESILVTTCDLDAPGPRIVYVNPAFEDMTGWSRAEAVGRSPRLLQGPKTDLSIFTDLRRTLGAGGTWHGKTINYRKDGTEFWMEWSIVPLRDERLETHHFVAVQRDVSARVAAERRLQEAQEAERVAERARTNLARYFSPKLVDVLAAKDKPLGPVRRQNLAVLFADVVGFTAMSETRAPEQVMEILRDIHGWMETAIFRWDGSVEGYIGDTVLAVFGFPEAGRRDAANALACGYDLLAAAERWNQGRIEEGQAPIRIGMGLQYGPVVLGDVGTKDYVAFTVIGDTVNTASRLQQASRTLACDLVVGRDLVQAIEADSTHPEARQLLDRLRYHGELALRGRTRAVEVWTSTLEPAAR